MAMIDELKFNGDDGSPVSDEEIAESMRRIAEAEAAGDVEPSWEAVR